MVVFGKFAYPVCSVHFRWSSNLVIWMAKGEPRYRVFAEHHALDEYYVVWHCNVGMIILDTVLLESLVAVWFHQVVKVPCTSTNVLPVQDIDAHVITPPLLKQVSHPDVMFRKTFILVLIHSEFSRSLKSKSRFIAEPTYPPALLLPYSMNLRSLKSVKTMLWSQINVCVF